jgi:hypothetical protein
LISGVVVKNKFSAMPFVDLQQDVKLLTTTLETLNDELKVYIVRV